MPEAGKQRFPTWWQALTLVLGGGVLGFTSCGAAIVSHNSAFGALFVIGFFAGAAAFVAGLVLLIMASVRAGRT
ncbi:MAG: hypothetical protein ACRD5K_09075 [Candidatus Acidiferrales bacterium]